MSLSMHVIRSESDDLNNDLIKFKAVRKVQGIGNTFYFQSLTYGDCHLYLQVPFFVSNGMTVSNFSNMRQMRVTFPTWQQNILKQIDSIAQEHVDCPDGAPAHWKKAFEEGSAYKVIPEFDSLFLKLSDHFKAFDLLQNSVDCDELKRGRYKVLVHITGLYLGAHGTTGKLASLQMKVLQLLFEPVPFDKCLITLDDDEKSNEEKELEDGKRRTRKRAVNDQSVKVKLRRQEAQSNMKTFFTSVGDEESQIV